MATKHRTSDCLSDYIHRTIDEELQFKLNTFGAVHITGPKWCGKTRTAEEASRSSIYFQGSPDKENLRVTASINPSVLLSGDKPKLIDEWQDAPEIWDAVRDYCDHSDGPGQFILTGSTSKKVSTAHTGTGRISELRMYPMSLHESGESNGTVSLKRLFDGDTMDDGCASQLTLEELIFAACRGGWPQSVILKDPKSKLAVAKDYFKQITTADMFSVDSVKRRPEMMETILRSYGRNISTLAKTKSIRDDINADDSVSQATLDNYLGILRDLFIIQDVNGWCPSLRSSAGMRSGPKREFVDPSIAVAALGTSPEKLNLDLKTFGFVFECLCIRDLRVYSSSMGGTVSYYHDRYGLEADAVLHLDDGRYGLIEFKLGSREIDAGAEHLLEIDRLIREHNEQESQMRMDPPSFKAVITAGQYGYRRPDGVFVIPIGCLGP